MKFYALTRPVTFTGWTMHGFAQRSVTFSPAENLQGFDHLVLNGETVTHHTAELRGCRIEVRNCRNTIKAFEHYGPLRFLFPGLRISGAESGELPHVAFTKPLLDALMTAAKPIEIAPKFYTVNNGSGYRYPHPRAGLEDVGTFFDPYEKKRLKIHVTVKFKKYGGEYTGVYIFPDEDLLRVISSVPPLGRPHWIKPLAEKLWRHGRDTFWPKKGDAVAAEMIAHHRTLDLLGALAIYDPGPECRNFFPSLKIGSVCSGHLADMKSFQIIRAIPDPF